MIRRPTRSTPTDTLFPYPTLFRSGIGKIARDQHRPAIRADDRYELVATASRHAQVDGVPGHADIAAMIAGDYRLGAVSICTPPVGRPAIAAIGRASCRERVCQDV